MNLNKKPVSISKASMSNDMLNSASIRERKNILFGWSSIVLIALVVCCAVTWFLWPAPIEFPMDDTYIHFVYAQNLVERGELIFNDHGESGLGTTSLAWVLLLALGLKIGIPLHVTAKVLGTLSLIVVGICLYMILRSRWPPLLALVTALLVVLAGHMLWFALNGMETVLFLALGMLALIAYRARKWVALGLLLGVMVLTRPEGLALALVITLVEVWQQKRLPHGVIITALVAFIICAPWFAYLYWRTGHFIPTSGIGKRLSMATAFRLVTGRNEATAIFGQFPSLIYPIVWIIYLLEFTLGGMALPPPNFQIGAVLGVPEYEYSIWALIGLVGVVIPLLWMFTKRVFLSLKNNDWIIDKNRRIIGILLLWMVLHNLIYMLFLPSPGTASRYGSINHVVLWLALSIGLFSYYQRPGLQLLLAGGLGVIAISNTLYWNDVYDANIDHMQNVRIAAAQYVTEIIPSGEVCAASDIGAIRYFSPCPIVDMCGLIDPDLGQVFLSGDMDEYLVDKDVSYLIIPGRAGKMDDGWFDHAEVLGLSSSPLFEMEKLIDIEIDRERWLQGYLPTNNYQATVSIYRLVR